MDAVTAFNLEAPYPTISRLTQDERESIEDRLEFIQHMLVSYPSLETSLDFYAEQIQYDSELLNGTYPHLWVNMHIFRP